MTNLNKSKTETRDDFWLSLPRMVAHSRTLYAGDNIVVRSRRIFMLVVAPVVMILGMPLVIALLTFMVGGNPKWIFYIMGNVGGQTWLRIFLWYYAIISVAIPIVIFKQTKAIMDIMRTK